MSGNYRNSYLSQGSGQDEMSSGRKNGKNVKKWQKHEKLWTLPSLRGGRKGLVMGGYFECWAGPPSAAHRGAIPEFSFLYSIHPA